MSYTKIVMTKSGVRLVFAMGRQKMFVTAEYIIRPMLQPPRIIRKLGTLSYDDLEWCVGNDYPYNDDLHKPVVIHEALKRAKNVSVDYGGNNRLYAVNTITDNVYVNIRLHHLCQKYWVVNPRNTTLIECIEDFNTML
jgi:hypothetical protein